MGLEVHFCLLILSVQIFGIMAEADNKISIESLYGFKSSRKNMLHNWKGSDTCSSRNVPVMSTDTSNISFGGIQGFGLSWTHLHYTSSFIGADEPNYQGTEVAEKNRRFLIDDGLSFAFSNCKSTSCTLGQTLSPNCKCSYPYTGTLKFFSLSLTDLGNSSSYRALRESLMSAFLSSGLPVDSVDISNRGLDASSYLQYRLQVFPSDQDSFNRKNIATIDVLLNQQPSQLQYLGPFFFIGDHYCCFSGESTTGTGESLSCVSRTIIGASVGASLLVVLVIFAGVYAFQQWRRARTASDRNNPIAYRDCDNNGGGFPQLNVARWFSCEELRSCTDNFSEPNCIGSGGYGKVYKGALASGQLVAIKRAQHGSIQGAIEFETEIELLSRIHHKNIVSLVGFCSEQGEQMLVYEYIPNGTLGESLSGKSGIELLWSRRLKIALDVARGLLYLHELANPPIIHRDIKSSNILLDDNLNAKVADFGVSKLMADGAKGYVTTQVKGTLGYMDPQYYMSQQLTEKCDVYSFGILLLELLTARAPIEEGKHIVKMVEEAMDNVQELQHLYQIVDPCIGPEPSIGGLEMFVDLAMSCVRWSTANRPTMNEVVREIENIIQLACSNCNAELESISSSSGDLAEGSYYHSCDSEAFDDIGGLSTPPEQHC